MLCLPNERQQQQGYGGGDNNHHMNHHHPHLQHQQSQQHCNSNNNGRSNSTMSSGTGSGSGKLCSTSLSKFTLPDENGKRKIRNDIMSIAEQLPALPGLYFDKKQKGFRVRYQNVYVGWVALSRFQSIEEAYISAREIWENAKLHAEKFQTPHAAIMASFPLQKESKASGKNRGGRPRTVTQLPINPQDWMVASAAAAAVAAVSAVKPGGSTGSPGNCWVASASGYNGLPSPHGTTTASSPCLWQNNKENTGSTATGDTPPMNTNSRMIMERGGTHPTDDNSRFDLDLFLNRSEFFPPPQAQQQQSLAQQQSKHSHGDSGKVAQQEHPAYGGGTYTDIIFRKSFNSNPCCWPNGVIEDFQIPERKRRRTAIPSGLAPGLPPDLPPGLQPGLPPLPSGLPPGFAQSNKIPPSQEGLITQNEIRLSHPGAVSAVSPGGVANDDGELLSSFLFSAASEDNWSAGADASSYFEQASHNSATALLMQLPSTGIPPSQVYN